jgi:hypothetical protein
MTFRVQFGSRRLQLRALTPSDLLRLNWLRMEKAGDLLHFEGQ